MYNNYSPGWQSAASLSFVCVLLLLDFFGRLECIVLSRKIKLNDCSEELLIFKDVIEYSSIIFKATVQKNSYLHLSHPTHENRAHVMVG